jgi:hypothetical protein
MNRLFSASHSAHPPNTGDDLLHGKAHRRSMLTGVAHNGQQDDANEVLTFFNGAAKTVKVRIR